MWNRPRWKHLRHPLQVYPIDRYRRAATLKLAVVYDYLNSDIRALFSNAEKLWLGAGPVAIAGGRRADGSVSVAGAELYSNFSGSQRKPCRETSAPAHAICQAQIPSQASPPRYTTTQRRTTTSDGQSRPARPITERIKHTIPPPGLLSAASPTKMPLITTIHESLPCTSLPCTSLPICS